MWQTWLYPQKNKLRLAACKCAGYVYNKKRNDGTSQLPARILELDLVSYLNVHNLIKPKHLYGKTFVRSKGSVNLILPEQRYSTSSKPFAINAMKLSISLCSNEKSIVNVSCLKLKLTMPSRFKDDWVFRFSFFPITYNCYCIYAYFKFQAMWGLLISDIVKMPFQCII